MKKKKGKGGGGRRKVWIDAKDVGGGGKERKSQPL